MKFELSDNICEKILFTICVLVLSFMVHENIVNHMANLHELKMAKLHQIPSVAVPQFQDPEALPQGFY